MALPTQIGSYRSHIQAMDLALGNADGCIVELADERKAWRFRTLCYAARKLYGQHTGDYNRWAGIMIRLDGNRVILTAQDEGLVAITAVNGNYEVDSALATIDEGANAGSDLAKRMLAQPEYMVPEHHRMPVSRASRARDKVPLTAEDISPDDVPRQIVSKQTEWGKEHEWIKPEGYDPAAPFAPKGANLFGDDDA